MKREIFAGAALLGLMLAGARGAPEPAHYETRAEHDHDGIGKFYLGREIAHIMGHQAAPWLERREREAEERTDLLVELLALRKGEAVADVGAGSGYFTWRMARLVGDAGRIYAVEIQQEMLDLLMGNMRKKGVEKRVTPVLGAEDDPRLPAGALDTILLVDVYHELEFPHEMTQAMVRALKPGGRLVLVEYRGEDAAVPIKPLHKMTEAQVRKEMAAHALKFERTPGSLPWQHVLIFRKPGGG